MRSKVFWITKSGVKIDIDEMEIDHLRNALKMIVRNWEARRNAEMVKSSNKEKIITNYGALEVSMDQNTRMNEILEIDEFFGED